MSKGYKIKVGEKGNIPWNKGNRKFNKKIYNIKIRKPAIDILGNKCVKCGFADGRALQIDHINGGGKKERLNMSCVKYYKMVVESVLNKEGKYQLLCANCNWIKRYENNEVGG